MASLTEPFQRELQIFYWSSRPAFEERAISTLSGLLAANAAVRLGICQTPYILNILNERFKAKSQNPEKQIMEVAFAVYIIVILKNSFNLFLKGYDTLKKVYQSIGIF